MIFRFLFYMTGGYLISLFNIWKIKKKLKLIHPIFSLKINENNRLTILGTGASINEIQFEDWKEIRKGTSIGINYFLFNEFVPDIIQLEIKRGEDKEYFNNLVKVLKSREDDFKNSVILIKSNYTRSNSELAEKIAFLQIIPSDLKKNLRFCVDFPIPATSLKEYKKALRITNRLGLFKLKSLHLTPHLRASVGLSTILGIKFGFSEIIYGGVDLNNSDTFYDEKALSKNYGIVLASKKIEGPHLTNDPDYSELTIVEVLNSLIKEIDSLHYFSVLSDKSALRTIMPRKIFNHLNEK